MAAVIASACAMLGAPAHAQSSNNDGYGLAPIPGVPAAQIQPRYPQPGFAPAPQSGNQFPPAPAPSMPVQQAPMNPAYSNQVYAGPRPYPQQQPYPPQQNYAQAQPYPGQGYAPAPVAAAPPPGYVPSAYGPPPAMRPAQNMPQNVAAAYDRPYGYAPLPGTTNAMPYGMTAGENIYAGYLLGPGDKVRVNVFGEEDLSGEYQVDGSGLVRLPLIGTIRAGGSTAPALGAAISSALAQGYLKNPRINVEITSYRPFYIIGAVNRPGTYPYVNNMTALDAVALGGGYTDKARESIVYVRHEGSTREEELPASQVTRVYPGDVVRVKTTFFWDAMDAISPVAGPAAIAAAAF